MLQCDYDNRALRVTLTMEVAEVSDVDAIALHPMASMRSLYREVLLSAYILRSRRHQTPHRVENTEAGFQSLTSV